MLIVSKPYYHNPNPNPNPNSILPQYKHCKQVTTSKLICYEGTSRSRTAEKRKFHWPWLQWPYHKLRLWNISVFIDLFISKACILMLTKYILYILLIESGDRQVDVQCSAVMKLNHSYFVLMQLTPWFLVTLTPVTLLYI